ncbi:uncharacterized protein LOC143298274 [Babylonia areolata]|uniref:uncharacterized protein LOC143298274 n=1 Tax=Babylonia areolata TaxID=304850 RepID=UPI003FD294D2
MQVANLPSDNSRASGHVTKRLLQGRPLPAILVDNHPGPRYPTFRPHQRRLSQQKGGSGAGREGASTPCDSGVSFSSMEGDPLSHLLPGPASGKSSQPIAITKMGRPKKKRHTPVAPPSTSTGTAPATVSGPGALGSSTAPSVGTGPGGGGGAGLMSSTSSGVSSGRTSEQLHRKAAAKASRMGQHDRATTMEGTDYFVNPEPVPSCLQLHVSYGDCRSSTMLKKIPIPKRHQDTFGGYEYNFTGQRGVMMHTDRYQVRKQSTFHPVLSLTTFHPALMYLTTFYPALMSLATFHPVLSLTTFHSARSALH